MTRFERWSVWITTGATLVTGVVYWWMADMLQPTDPWSVINHPLQPWVLKAHILVAPFLVFSVGLITSRHIWRHYRLGVRKGRVSGLVAATTFGVMVLSGYLLQVFTADAVVTVLKWSHLGLGIVYSVGVAVHRPATARGRAPRLESAGSPGSRPGSEPGPAESAGAAAGAGGERSRRAVGRR